ncbi:transcript variant X4 [Nothobranchius furzeri]|uniref:Transcript variant X4 n=1 Tax=Nothobranchius furzeri TaxID=105023 RepID=A0A9D2YUA5_NOTFU|nr:transcript variant X4 [Nothobranchius furzeri]
MSTQGMKCQTLSNSLLKQEGESRSSRDTPSGSTNYNAKGSKWAISTNFETLCNLTAGSSGKSSRDPSPRREMTTSLEQDKDKYDKSRRREMKNEKMGSKGGYNDTEPRRHVESERISDSRLRDAEWVVRERKPEYDASKQDMKKKRKKGDTFPRIKNGDRDPDPRVMPPEMEKERRHGHRPKREETQFWEEKIDKHKIRMRRKEDGKSPGRRPTEDERAQKRELYKMSGVEFRDTTRETIDRQDMRDRVAARRREDMRLDLDERNARMNSQQRTEREMYGRTQGRTVAKSEGDIDERRDKMRDRRGEEGDYMSKMQHNRDRDRHSGRGTEAERPRRKEEATFDRCTETDRRIARQVDKERERQMETRKDFSGYRREDDQIRRERRAREMLERREHATAERRNRSTSDPDPRVPPRVQSNRELTSSKDDNDDHSKSWGGMELRNVLDEIKKSQKSHGFFKDTQLYQQYIDTTQEFEILRSRSDVLSTFEDASLSPAPSPPPSRRPLPPLPSQPHLHSLSHTGSVTSAKNLPLPELPNTERRPSSPRLSISLSQSSLLWRELEDVRYSPDLELLTEDQRRLQEVRFEVVTSEASYCRSLDIVVDHFVKSKQLGQLLTTQDKNWLFSRLADVRTISRRFLSMLEQRMESDIMRFTVCDIIAEHCPRFRCVYVPYLTNQSYQDATYQKLMNGNPGFKQVVETLEKSQVCERLPLRSFLVLPFQRITRIKLLVQNIVKRTTPGTEEATHAIRALKLLEKMIRESNESISQMKNLESLVALNSKVNFECKTLPLVSQSRRLVREGAITKLSNSLKEPEKSIYLHLFNDYLLFSVPKEGGRFTVINHYPVTELCAEDCPVKLDTLQKNLFRLRTKQNLLLLRADSASDKLRWISAISPPQPIELSSVQDCAQMQCIRAYVAQQPDELSLEKADVILVHQDCDNWVEGTKLSDLHRGWMPKSHLEAIVNPKVRKRNLSDALKVTNATATA